MGATGAQDHQLTGAAVPVAAEYSPWYHLVGPGRLLTARTPTAAAAAASARPVLVIVGCALAVRLAGPIVAAAEVVYVLGIVVAANVGAAVRAGR